VLEAAAGWWQRLRGHEPYDTAAFEAWLRADPRHGEALERVKAGWDSFDDYQTSPELLALRTAALNRVYRTGRRRWGAPNSLHAPNLYAPDRRALIAACAAGMAAIVAAPLWLIWRGRDRRLITTAVGEQRAFTLPDSSRVTLDANSQLKIGFDRDLRRIDLVHGRAHFEVAKDPSRPFKVHALDSIVTAVGTAFTVELREQKVQVTLFEGRITLADGARPQVVEEIRPLEQVTLRSAAAQPVVEQVDPRRALAWRDGKLFFNDEPLSEAAARMNDYSNTRITVEGPAANLRVSGMFIAGQTGPFIEALEAYYPVRAWYTAEGVTIKSRS
jgi:transmembrane sensor